MNRYVALVYACACHSQKRRESKATANVFVNLQQGTSQYFETATK